MPAAMHLHRHTPAREAHQPQPHTQALQAAQRLLREKLPRANRALLPLRQLQHTTEHTAQVPPITEVQAVAAVQPALTERLLPLHRPNRAALTVLRQGVPVHQEVIALPEVRVRQVVTAQEAAGAEVQDHLRLHQADVKT